MTEPSFAVAIGASTGGVDALLAIAAALPAHFPAAVFVTQHIGANDSILPALLRSRGPNPALHPHDGELLRTGTIYVAPPDRHLMVANGRIHLSPGPRENHCRPSIDPMFRSVALEFRARAIGLVLSGSLDDGAAGLAAIKSCGGTAIVQDPATAFEPSMPKAALAAVRADLVLTLEGIVPALEDIVRGRPNSDMRDVRVPELLRREEELAHEDDLMEATENLQQIAKPSSLTCPECGGSLWELADRQPLRYRCHTGHAYSAGSLEHSQKTSAEQALWSGVRALRERAMLLRRVAQMSRGNGQAHEADAGESHATHLDAQAEALVGLIEQKSGGA